MYNEVVLYECTETAGKVYALHMYSAIPCLGVCASYVTFLLCMFGIYIVYMNIPERCIHGPVIFSSVTNITMIVVCVTCIPVYDVTLTYESCMRLSVYCLLVVFVL